MDCTETALPGVFLIKPKVFSDARGYFFESFREDVMRNIGVKLDFVQDNQSCSSKNVLRGLHFQSPPFDQGKLVRVITGAVLDVAVDIRKKSPTYGQHIAVELSEDNKHLLWIPPGFAHGFITLADHAIFHYKCTNYYNKSSEGCIIFNDADLNINWGTEQPILSEKDLQGVAFKELNSPFT